MSGYSSNPYAQARPVYNPSAQQAGGYPQYPQQPAYPGAYAAPSAGPVWDPSYQQPAYTPDAYQQSSAYAGPSAPLAEFAPKPKPTGRKTVLRKGGGQVWEDQTLLEWDPAHFRLFVGDLDPALSDELLEAAFRAGGKYPSFVKSKIIREKHSNKGKGFGFVAYSDPEDFLKAWKELNGKYIGTVSSHTSPCSRVANPILAPRLTRFLLSQRPVTIKKATGGVAAVNIGARKAAELDAKHKPKTGTVPYNKANAEEAVEGRLDGRTGGYGPERSRKSCE